MGVSTILFSLGCLQVKTIKLSMIEQVVNKVKVFHKLSASSLFPMPAWDLIVDENNKSKNEISLKLTHSLIVS